MDIAGWHINAYLKGATMKKLFLALFLLPILGYAQTSNFWLLKNNVLFPVVSTWKVGAGTASFGTSAYTDSNYVNAKIIAGGGTIVHNMAFADSTSYHGSVSIITVGALTTGSIGTGFTNIDSAHLANIVSKILTANTFLISGNSGGNAKYLTIDTTKYSTSSMTGFTSYIEKATWDAKQNAIANLADTSKYKKGYDSVASTGYASIYQNNLKQNIISNLADTSKYKKGYDSTASTGFASVYQVGLKQNLIANLADTSKYKKGYDSTASTGYASVYQVGSKEDKSDTNNQLRIFTVVPVANGGTGRATGTTPYALITTGTIATGAQQTLASTGTAEQMLLSGGASALPVWTNISMTISFPLDSSFINLTDTIWCDLPGYVLTVDSISVSPDFGGVSVSYVPKFLYRIAPMQTCTAIITSPATITSSATKTWQSTINAATLPVDGQLGVLHTNVTTKPKQESIGIKVHR
jgi:hypothetical protein